MIVGHTQKGLFLLVWVPHCSPMMLNCYFFHSLWMYVSVLPHIFVLTPKYFLILVFLFFSLLLYSYMDSVILFKCSLVYYIFFKYIKPWIYLLSLVLHYSRSYTTWSISSRGGCGVNLCDVVAARQGIIPAILTQSQCQTSTLTLCALQWSEKVWQVLAIWH